MACSSIRESYGFQDTHDTKRLIEAEAWRLENAVMIMKLLNRHVTILQLVVVFNIIVLISKLRCTSMKHQNLMCHTQHNNEAGLIRFIYPQYSFSHSLPIMTDSAKVSVDELQIHYFC